MRSNSGRDEGRNNMRDPTMRERSMQRGSMGNGGASAKSTHLGSNRRKKGGKGDR